MYFSATVPESVIVAGTARSILPGPSVMTNICPVPTITENAAKVSAACVSPTVLAPAGRQDGDQPDRARRDKGPEPRFAQQTPSCPRRLAFQPDQQNPKRQNDDQDHPLRTDLPVGRHLQEGQERPRQQAASAPRTPRRRPTPARR